jgi:hypothetical protein
VYSVKISHIKDSISSGEVSIELRASLDNLIPDYKRSLSKLGNTVPIRAIEDVEFDLGIADIRALCQFYVSGALSGPELAYIADVLQLSDSVNFVEPDVADYVAEFTDSEVNGVFSKERASDIVQSYT